jgi:hypothetical protein
MAIRCEGDELAPVRRRGNSLRRLFVANATRRKSSGIAIFLTVVAKTRFEYFMRGTYPAAVIVLDLAIRR